MRQMTYYYDYQLAKNIIFLVILEKLTRGGQLYLTWNR